jgi:hypothetical protein
MSILWAKGDCLKLGSIQEMADAGQLGQHVRSYLHYDQLASNLFKQSTRARQVAGEFEQKVVGQLEQSRMEKAIIQIGGGHLNEIEEKTPHCLTLSKITSLIHGYYASRGPKVRDETEDILRYIRANRGSDIKKRLKKTMTGGALPALPPANGGSS